MCLPTLSQVILGPESQKGVFRGPLYRWTSSWSLGW